MTVTLEHAFAVASVAVLVVGLVVSAVREARSSAARAGVAAMLFASQIAIVVFLLYAISFDKGAYPVWFYAIVFAASLLCVVASTLLMRGLEGVGRRRLDAARVGTLEQQMAAVRAYEARLDEERKRSRALRERIVELLRAAERDLDRNEVGAAVGWAQKAVDVAQPRRVRRCGSATIDAVLAKKEEACEAAGVRLDALVELPAGIEQAIPTPVLVAFFANSIDNAIAASKQAPVDRRFVEVRSRVEAGWLLFEVVNGVSGERSANAEGGRPSIFRPVAPSVDLAPEHGWGLGIMRDLARRYGGAFAAEASDGRFRVSIAVPVPQSSSVVSATRL